MNVLFLDCDGVVNNKQHLYAIKDKKVKGANTLNDANLFHMKKAVAPQNMWVLGYIMKEVPDLKIVISSAWRNHFDMIDFKELFKIFKLDGDRIIGKTPKKLTSERCHEIKEWLDDYEEIHHKKIDWVAVDDHVIFNLGDPEKANEFLTDSWIGLKLPDAFKIIKHFNPLYKSLEINI